VKASIGIDIGGTKLLAVRLHDEEMVAKELFSTPGEDMVGSVVAAVGELWTNDVTSVGVGVAGLVRFSDGVFVWGPHVPGADVPVREIVESEYGVPVIVDNE
jgi:predicted NBD/HSP70 family sugar kinase